MHTAHSFFSRRSFLARGFQLLSATITVPNFLHRSARCLAAERANDRVLVVVQLGGGNDGLNTVVPIRNDDYYRARPTLAVPKSAALPLNDDFGLHPSCAGFKAMYDAGDLAIVQAVGYPNLNRSHFRGSDIWFTAEPERLGSTGWLGRFCDAVCRGEDAEGEAGMALAMGSEPPVALRGSRCHALTFDMGHQAGDAIAHEMSDQAASGPTAGGEQFIERTVLNARFYSDKIARIRRSAAGQVKYPEQPLAQSMREVARLIASDMPTRIYYVKIKGFDTHAGQLEMHPKLLQELSGSIAAFVEDLKQSGHYQRTVLMTFSEFGRRVAENASGTDHGEAAPMFFTGGGIKPGFFGTFPSLAPERLHRGDVPFTTDFRQVYATVLRRWLGADDVKILGGSYESLDLFKRA